MSEQCQRPGCISQAINHHHHGRNFDDLQLCDVCFWRAKAEQMERVVAAAECVGRGCNCEHDYRCSNCSAIIALHAEIATLKEN